MRILITGARGQLGQSLRRALPEDWELIATDSKTLDITNAEAVESMIAGFQPDTLINAAAYTNVDAAENDAAKAFAVNALGTQNLARAAHRHGTRLIHFSTDYVFDGCKGTPYTEEDIPAPLNVYGQSKLAGEVLALAANANTLIIRTSGLFSAQAPNFVTSVLARLRAGEKIEVVTDQICCPTYAPDLALAVITLIRDYPAVRGILHHIGTDVLSWYDFAQKIAAIAACDSALVQPISSSEQAVRRPAYSVLASVFPSQHTPLMSLERAIAASITP